MRYYRFSYLTALVISFSLYGLLIPIYTIFMIYRVFVLMSWKMFRPNFKAFVTGCDALFTRDNLTDGYANIMVSFVTEKEISVMRLREMFQERILPTQNDQVYLKLKCTMRKFLGYLFWEEDGTFDLGNHVRTYDYEHTFRCGPPKDKKVLEQVLGKLAEAPFPEGRSHWEVLVSRGFKDQVVGRKDLGLLIFRFDHALVDGMSLLGMFRKLFHSPFTVPNVTRNDSCLSPYQWLCLLATFPAQVLRPLPIMCTKRFLRKRDFSKAPVFDISERLPVDWIKEIRRKEGVEFTSVVHSAVHTAIYRTLKEISCPEVPQSMTMLSVIPLNDHPGGMCNHFRTFLVDFPYNNGSQRDQLLKINEILKEYQKDLSPIAIFYFGQIISKLPVKIARQIYLSSDIFGPSYVMSNLPVTLAEELINEETVIVDMIFTANTILQTGLLITSWGVNNQQRFGFSFGEDVFGEEVPQGSLSMHFHQALKELQSV